LCRSYIYAIIGGLCLGIGNFMLTEVSMRIGIKSIYASFLSFFITWTGYHSYFYIKNRINKGGNYLSKETSSYYKKE